ENPPRAHVLRAPSAPRRSAMRNATSDSCRISLSVSCDIEYRAYRLALWRTPAGAVDLRIQTGKTASTTSIRAMADAAPARAGSLGGGLRALEVLVRRAV